MDNSQLRMGSIVVTEGKSRSIVSRLIAYFTGSWATHTFVVLAPEVAVEAKFPRVRFFDASKRMAELEREKRAYVIMDFPLTTGQRFNIGKKATEFVGRWYDLGQILLYMLTRNFWCDGEGTLTCSRLVTASFWSGAGIDLFPDQLVSELLAPDHPRAEDLRKGYSTPADLLVSRLEIQSFVPSRRIKSLEDFLPRSLRSHTMTISSKSPIPEGV